MNFDLMDPVSVIMGAGCLEIVRVTKALGLIRRRIERPTSAHFNPMAGCEAVSMLPWDTSGRHDLT